MTAANRVFIALIAACSAIVYGYYLQVVVVSVHNHLVPAANPDDIPAATWQRCAEPAHAGNPLCQFHLGMQLVQASGMAQKGMMPDSVRGIALITSAADQGLVEAQLQLGVGYASGMLGTKDLDKAMYWITRAAQGGSAEAQFYLGSARETGNYTQLEQDYQQAYIWFSLALRNGNSKALRQRDEVLSFLSPAQRDSADAEVNALQQSIDERRHHEHDLFRI